MSLIYRKLTDINLLKRKIVVVIYFIIITLKMIFQQEAYEHIVLNESFY